MSSPGNYHGGYGTGNDEAHRTADNHYDSISFRDLTPRRTFDCIAQPKRASSNHKSKSIPPGYQTHLSHASSDSDLSDYSDSDYIKQPVDPKSDYISPRTAQPRVAVGRKSGYGDPPARYSPSRGHSPVHSFVPSKHPTAYKPVDFERSSGRVIKEDSSKRRSGSMRTYRLQTPRAENLQEASELAQKYHKFGNQQRYERAPNLDESRLSTDYRGVALRAARGDSGDQRVYDEAIHDGYASDVMSDRSDTRAPSRSHRPFTAHSGCSTTSTVLADSNFEGTDASDDDDSAADSMHEGSDVVFTTEDSILDGSDCVSCDDDHDDVRSDVNSDIESASDEDSGEDYGSGRSDDDEEDSVVYDRSKIDRG